MEVTDNIINYNPLDASRREIRLVALMPALNFEDDIYCELRHVSLHDKPKYAALSYAWGDPSITSQIFVQGQPFQATTNLVSALRHLRLPHGALSIWADAIAINQRDLGERSQQVGFMAEIYKSALCDLLWLGPETEELSHAFQIFDIHYDFFDAGAPAPTISSKEAWSILVQNSSVWQRFWVVQELVFAKDIWLVCGHKKARWQSELYIIEPDSIQDPKLQIDGLRFQRQTDLLSIWTRFRHYQCTDPRDRLFAIMGIGEDIGIAPDYETPAEEVFYKIAKALILKNRTLDLLNYCRSDRMIEIAAKSRTDAEFHEALPAASRQLRIGGNRPSWVPDFANQRKLENECLPGTWYYGNPTTGKRSWGEGTWANSHCPQWAFSEDSLEKVRAHCNASELKLNGIMIDKVDVIRRCSQPSPENTSATSFYAQLYRELSISMPKRWKYFNGDSLHKAYWRTLFCDSIYHSRITSGHIRRRWKEYVRTIEGKRLGTIPSKLMSLSMSERQKANYPQEMEKLFHELESSLPINSSYNFSTTAQGYFALVPCETLPGDLVCGLEGGHVPYVLRRVTRSPEEDSMLLVGPAYIHGLMDGKILELRDEGKLQQHTFILV